MATRAAYAAIDLETTGLSRDSDEIIEVGIVRCTPDEVESRWGTLVRPAEMPSLRVSRLTGITAAMLLEAPRFEEIEAELREHLAGAAPIGHNVHFDLEFLEGYGIRADRPPIDTFPLSQIIDPAAPSHRLGDLCERYGIALDEAHRAAADADAARMLLLALRERFGALPDQVRADLQQIAAKMGFGWELSRIITELREAHPPRIEAPGRRRAGRSSEEGPPLPARVRMPAGSLAQLAERAFDKAAEAGFLQRRGEQLEMAAAVADAFTESGGLVVEAGTGTGKSLAYLAPAALYALGRGERVVVSTYTKNLQEQLLSEDLPRLRRILRGVIGDGADALEMAVLKGRENYLCRRELDGLRERLTEPEEALLAARATVWAPQTETGDKAELRLIRPLEPIWDRISARATTCLTDQCPYVVDGSCFLLRARAEAAGAHLIVVNHALLVADAGLELPAIPEAPILVVDEAQELEGVATAWLSESVSEPSLVGLIEAVGGRIGRNDRRSGGLADSLPAEAGEARQALRAATADLADPVDALFTACEAFMREHGTGRGGDEIVLDRGKRAQKQWSEVESRAQPVADALGRIADLLAAAGDGIGADDPDLDEDERAEAAALLRAIRDRETEAREAGEVLQNVLAAHPEETISWLARAERTGEASIHAAPFSVADWLRERVWDRKRASLLTGATLAHEGSFERLRTESGMSEPSERLLGSPFDYERQARVYAAIDAPPVNAPEYAEWLEGALPMLAKAAGGRTMVLFTAYGMMRQAARATRATLELADLALAVQGSDGGPANVVRALIEDPKTVVYGVQSLWAGVDVPGEALSQLVIARLPFPRPNEPVQAGRSAQYENPFIEQTLPQAITMFRQGFGRLIRSASDRGVCVILDERIASKRYGAQFAAALPVEHVEQAPVAEIAVEVARFLGPGGDR